MSGSGSILGESADWFSKAGDVLSPSASRILHLVGLGNPVREDDSVGLYIAGSLRRRMRGARVTGVRIHPLSLNPERVLSRIDCNKHTLLLLDAAETGREPGYTVFASIRDTAFGYFATHNLPLRLIPNLTAGENVYIIGVQPERLGVGDTLSDAVRRSADMVVELLSQIIGGRVTGD